MEIRQETDRYETIVKPAVIPKLTEGWCKETLTTKRKNTLQESQSEVKTNELFVPKKQEQSLYCQFSKT